MEPCTCRDLFDAAEKGCEEHCREYLDQAGQTRDGIWLKGWGTKNNRTALMVAANYGNTECVRVLAQKEAKMKDDSNNTALMFAAGEGHLECVKVLAPLEKEMVDKRG